MKTNIYTIWPLYVGVILLLLNDHFLKFKMPGVTTGKVSDVAGIFIIVLVLNEIFKNRIYTVACGVVLVFTWWKSPYSQSLINLVNSFQPYPMVRVVDYSDLLALFIIPVANYVFKHKEQFSITKRHARYVKVPAMAITALAIMGTSIMLPHQNYQIRKEQDDQSLDIAIAIEIIRREVSYFGLECIECSVDSGEGVFESKSLHLKYTVLDDNRGIAFDIRALTGGGFFSGDKESDLEAIKKRLQYAFALEFSEMEFVIKLRP